MYEDRAGDGETALDDATRAAPVTEVVDDDGVCHRLWVVPEDGDAGGVAARLVHVAGREPVTIADGHHRYETALRYRDERRMSRSCEEDPPFDYLLALFLEATRQPLTVLPTHRLIHGAGGDDRLDPAALERLFTVERGSREALAKFGAGERGGRGRFGLWTAAGGLVLAAKRDAVAPHLPPGGEALRGLDVTVLAVALEQLVGIDREAVAAGGRVSYTKSASDAIAAVDAGRADAAFLLEPTPVDSILRVAEQGDVMPQKSTYFYPKPLSGLVINPLEW